MNKTFLSLLVAGSIAAPSIVYIERESIKAQIDLLLNPQEIDTLILVTMLLDSVKLKGEQGKSVLYDCLQNIPQEYYSEEKK